MTQRGAWYPGPKFGARAGWGCLRVHMTHWQPRDGRIPSLRRAGFHDAQPAASRASSQCKQLTFAEGAAAPAAWRRDRPSSPARPWPPPRARRRPPGKGPCRAARARSPAPARAASHRGTAGRRSAPRRCPPARGCAPGARGRRPTGRGGSRCRRAARGGWRRSRRCRTGTRRARRSGACSARADRGGADGVAGRLAFGDVERVGERAEDLGQRDPRHSGRVVLVVADVMALESAGARIP